MPHKVNTQRKVTSVGRMGYAVVVLDSGVRAMQAYSLVLNMLDQRNDKRLFPIL